MAPRAAAGCAATVSWRWARQRRPAPPSPNARYSVRAGGATAAEVRLPTTSWVDARQMMTARASDTQTPRSLSVSKSEAPDGAMAALFGSTRSPPLGSARLPAAPLGAARLPSAPLVSPRCRSAPSGAARRPLGAARRRLAPLGRTPAGRLLAQRPRRCRGGGELPVANTRASQSKMAARAPIRAPACLSSPACHPDTEGGAHSSTWAIICHREGGGGGVGAAASSRLQILASQSKMAARAPIHALMCRLGRLCCCVSVLARYRERATTTNPLP